MLEMHQDWSVACAKAGLSNQLLSTPFFGMALLEYLAMTNAPHELLAPEAIKRLSSLSNADVVKLAFATLINRCGTNEPYVNTLISLSFSVIGDPLLPPKWKVGDVLFKPYESRLDDAR